jgi:2-polyprenyl-6-methoxyphenol hydroxylase-like FAD-dependent oxidoreductase
MSFSPKIAIVGAGPGGLTLGRLLQCNKVPFTIYELECGPSSRNQGGTLDLHQDSGQLALREAGLIEEFRQKARPEGEALRVSSPAGNILWNQNGSGAGDISGRPEIDRLVLRDLLLGSVEPDKVHWGRKLLRVEPGENNTHNLHFEDGLETGFDLVVGADGAWSKVRPLLTDTKPFYSGITMIELWALDVEARKSWLSNYVGAGSFFMFDEGRAIIAQRNGGGSIRSYACVRQGENWVNDCGIDWGKPAAAREQLVDTYFGDCGEDLKRIILESGDELIPRILYMLPVDLTWPPHAGVTLLGDAAHLMTVFAGVGVNLAMHDALDLAKEIIACQNKEDLAGAIRRYEAGMFERGKENAIDTFEQMGMCFSKGGSEKMVQMLEGFGLQG